MNTAAVTTPAIAVTSEASCTRGSCRNERRPSTITSAAANTAISGAMANQSIDGVGMGAGVGDHDADHLPGSFVQGPSVTWPFKTSDPPMVT